MTLTQWWNCLMMHFSERIPIVKRHITVMRPTRHILHIRVKLTRPLHIQGVSRLVDITAGGDFLGLCDQKSSYKHVSDFGRLRSYGHLLIPVLALMWTTSYGTSRWVTYSTWRLIVCVASIIIATWLMQFTTERQPVLRPAVAFSKNQL